VHSVHWKASARQRRLIVKEFEPRGTTHITLLLDTDGNFLGNDPYENNFEFLVSFASSVIHYLSGIYTVVSFITADDKSDTVLHCSGSAYSITEKTDNILAELQCGKKRVELLLEAALEIVPDNSLFYCLSMSANENMYRYFDIMSAGGIDIRWYCAPPECFPEISHLGENGSETEIVTLTGYGMHSPEPFILKRGMAVDDFAAGML
jgi:hypothetical protein